jgi:hypothetical protein
MKTGEKKKKEMKNKQHYMQADKYSITNFINVTINGSTITSTNVIF